MKNSKPLYLTTTLPYVNADPHIGFAVELLHADAYARFNRLIGRDVFFNFGTDEHGQKIWQKAQDSGRDVQEYVDDYAKRFDNLKEALNLSYDAFIRTTDPHHINAAQEMWRRADVAGDIYKKSYTGLYCVGCEAFVKEGDLVDGKCPNHPTQMPEEISEENYFFRFSKYQDRLLEYLKGDVILPDWRKEEAIKFVQNGLEDFSISRQKERMPWGVPVPEDDEQVMYVWFDALTNYISTLGWSEDKEGKFEKYWTGGEVLQFAGKDQVRFQSLIWQAMLFSVGVKNTDKVIYNGFITSAGQKMSKSLGNVISPFDMVEKYGTDAVRYYLLRHIHPYEDSDMTEEKLRDAYNGNLANGLGNLTARIMKMAEDNLPEAPEIPDNTIPESFKKAVSGFQFNEAMEIVWREIGELDAKIQETAPFKLVKEDKEKALEIIQELAVRLYTVGRMLNPLMPQTSVKIKEAIKQNKKPETLFPRIS
jgi:methionyl-tRNA synthetase